MTPIDIDKLLREAAWRTEERDDRPLDDGVLRAYRRGELAEVEQRRVERHLAGSAVARQRLAELAGVAPAPVRLPRSLVPPSRRAGWLLAAGLAAVLVAGGLWLTRLRGGEGEPTLLAGRFEVSVEALAVERSTGAAGRVQPDTRVQIRVEPAEAARAGVEFALYRRSAGSLERVPTRPPVELTVTRGAALFSAPAAALLGPSPGERQLFVVAAAAGELPSHLDLAPGADPIALLAAGGRRFVDARSFSVEPVQD